MVDTDPVDVQQHTAAQQVVEFSSPEPAAFRFWKEIKAKTETLELFLGYVFALKPTPNDTIRPFYQKWKMAGYIRTGGGNMVTQDNVDLGAMRVNREFRDAGSRLAYGRYIFHFKDAQNCLWWTKHIGHQNFSNLKMFCVSMQSGWDIPCKIISRDVDLCHEEQWHQFFSWLRHRHQMDALVLDFSCWEPVQSYKNLTEEWQTQLMEWREALLNKLSDLRGFTLVNIFDRFEVAIPKADQDEWAETLCQAREPLPPIDPTPMPLGQTLEHLREMRRQREYRERMEKKSHRKEKKNKKQQKRLETKAKEADGSADAK